MRSIKPILVFVTLCIVKSSIYGQCNIQDLIDTIKYCPSQNAAWQVTNSSGAVYKWYRTSTTVTGKIDYVGTGNYFETLETYNSGSGTANLYYYEKEFPKAIAPVLNTTTLPTKTADQANSVSLPYTSTQNFKLNYVVVALTPHWNGNTNTFSINVGANGITSDWYTFKLTDAIANNGTTFFFKVPVKAAGATNVGMDIPAGNSSIVIGSCGTTGTCPSGSTNFDNSQGTFALFSSPTLNTTYALGSNVTLDYGTGSNKVGIFDVDLTYTCGKTQVFSSEETDLSKCCTPLSSSPNIVSTQSSTNIYDTIFPPNVKLTALGSNPSHYFIWYKEGVQIAAGVGLTQLTISDYGYYDVKEVEDVKYENRTACFEIGSYQAVKKLLFAKALPTKTICQGDSANLSAIGATANINWSTSSGLSILRNTGQIATVKPTALGSYLFSVTATLPNNNLVRNGDFEQGNTGFQTNYSYLDPNLATGTPPRKNLTFTSHGQYTVNDYVFDPGWDWANCKGRGGTGKFLYADGADQSNKFVWKESITVVAGKQYEFSAWFTNIHTSATASNLPKPIIYIDGIPTNITLQQTPCLWQKVSTLWTAPTSGTITIVVDELTHSANGNDFAIDDIAFGTPGQQTDTVSIKVVDCTLLPLNFISFDVENLNGLAKLNWTYTKMGPASIFVVEKSSNGTNYHKIGEVASTNSEITYFDPTFNNETVVYYRVKYRGELGEETSKVVVLYPNDETKVQVYPNPSHRGFYVNISSLSSDSNEITIIDYQGRILDRIIAQTSHTVLLGENLPKGIYMLQVKSQEEISTYKIVKE